MSATQTLGPPPLPRPAVHAVVPRAPGTIRVTIRAPEDAAASMATMKYFVQGFAHIAVKHVRAADAARAPIDFDQAA